FEYITGGGFSREALPASLLAEGELMLRALLDDCRRMDALSLSVLLDWRCLRIADAYAVTPMPVGAVTDVNQVFQQALDAVDAVWLIAPEFSGILQGLTEQVEAAGKRLLSSSSIAVALTANKYRTFQHLQANGIASIHTALLHDHTVYQSGCWVIKPIDGAGCTSTWRVDSAAEFAATLAKIDDLQQFIIQPYIAGQAMSLSCLFYQGQGWVLCVNEQRLTLQERYFTLLACQVNTQPITSAQQALVTAIAQAIPGLHGYVGIDFIQMPEGTAEDAAEQWLVEINPRLTSSYAGLHRALGLNVVELVLQLGQHAPVIQPVCNQQVTVTLV
ncbi:MAG: ATP-grasp domain-containing protein, partial [Methylococcaceae bacterium]